MSEVTFKFSGLQGVIALVVAVLFVIVRLATLGESDDETLHTVVHGKLLNEVGTEFSRNINTLDTSDPDVVEKILEQVDEEEIEVHSVKVSRPLLSFESNQRVIVLVEYTLPGISKRVDYWRFRDRLIGGWQYKGPSSAFSYYLNFM